MQKISRHRLQTLKSASITFDYIDLDNAFQKPVMNLGIKFLFQKTYIEVRPNDELQYCNVYERNTLLHYSISKTYLLRCEMRKPSG